MTSLCPKVLQIRLLISIFMWQPLTKVITVIKILSVEAPSPNCGGIVARPFNGPNTNTHFLYYGYSIGKKQRPLIITVCKACNEMITYVLDQIASDSNACHWPWSSSKSQRSLSTRISAYISTIRNIFYRGNNSIIIICYFHTYVF